MMILVIAWNQLIPHLNVVDRINVRHQGRLIPNVIGGPPQGIPDPLNIHGKKVDKTLTVHVELGKTSLNFGSRS